MASLANLVVTLAADTAAFTTGFDKASREGKRTLYKMEKDIEASARRIGVAFAAAATAMAVIVKRTVDVADQMRDLSMQTGISTEVLSGYAYAAEQSGTSLETLTGGIRKMQKSIVDAASGMTEQSQAFDRLGLSAEQLLQMSPDKAFELIAEKLSKMENASLRAATAQEIFGRSGTKLLPLMADGAAGIQEMTDKVDAFNATISQEFANNADRFNDNLGDMKQFAKGAAITFTEALLPSLIGVQEYLIKAATGSNDFSGAAETLIEWVKRLIGGFILLKGILQAVGVVIVAVADTLIQSFSAMIAPITGLVDGLAHALNALKQGDLQAAADALADIPSKIGEKFVEGFTDAKRAMGFIGEGIAEIQDETDRSLAELEKAFTPVEAAIEDVGSAALDTATDFGKLNKQLDDARKKYADTKVWKSFETRLKAVNDVIKDAGTALDELVAENEAFEASLESVLDSLYPVQAEGKRLGDTLAVLTRAVESGAITWAQYQDAVLRATAGFDAAVTGIHQTAEEMDLLSVAIDEGVRILERTFADLFSGLVDGSLDAWDTIESGFQSMIASISQAAARGVTIRIQEAFGKGGGGLSDLDLSGAFGQDLLAAIGSIVGLSSADSLFGQIGSTLGNIFGEAVFEKIGSALFPQLLGALGSWAGPIGTALGAILGSALGDLIGGLFERDLQFSLGGSANARANDAQRIRTPLGDIFGISGQGGFGSLNDPSTLGGQLAEALTQFDTAIADFLQDFASDEQFAAIRASLEGWIGTWGEGAEAADVIQSRFNVILSSFSGDIRAFVANAEDFEEQIQRFGVALSADKLIRENPEVFSGRTTGELLNLIGAFQSGAETMEDAFNEFLVLFTRVLGIQQSLKSYADSDLLTDFAALNLDLTLAESLARVNSELMDAVANFDGSVESFEKIGILALAAREGELKLLSEIDAIQKGINSNLDKLKADILGINAPDTTGEQLFNQAQDLIGKITASSTAQDVAGIQQQFDSLIRSIAPEDQLAMQSEIVAIIELFRARANDVLNARRQETLDSAAVMRDMIDGLLVRVGDPLDLIAASLDGRNIPEVMEDGLSAINQSVASIGPQVAQAVQSGLAGVQVNVVLSDGGLVTQ